MPETALEVLPPKLRNKAIIEKIGQNVLLDIEQSKVNTISLRDTRDQNLALYRGINLDPTPKDKNKKRPRYSVPVMKPRINQRAANFSANLCQPDPIFTIYGLDSQTKINAQETLLAFALNNIKIEAKVRTAGKKAMLRHSAIIRVGNFNFPDGFEGAAHSGSFCGPVWDIMDPDDFAAWPNIRGSFEQTVTHGHRFEMADFVIRQKITKGEYLPDRLSGSFSGGVELKPVITGEKQDGITGAQSSRTTHIWDVLHRHILNEKTGEEIWLRVVVDCMGRVLRISEWEHPVSWYVLMQDDDEAKGIWSETGVASDCAGWQNVLNAVVNEIVYNGMRQSRAPVLYEKGMMSSDVDGHGDDQFIEVKSLEKVMPLPVSNAVEELLMIVNMCMNFADSASHSSSTITGGGNTGPETTATEEQIKYQGFQLATSDDVAMFGDALIKAARLSLYWITYYWDEWSACYKNEIDAQQIDIEQLKAKSIITLNGQAPSQLPQQQVQTAQTVLMLLSQVIADKPEFEGIKVKLMKTIIENMPLKGKEELMPLLEEMEKEADEAMAMQKMMAQLQAQLPPGAMQALMASGQIPQGALAAQGAPALPPASMGQQQGAATVG